MKPLFSQNRVPVLESLFRKPNDRDFEVAPPIAEQFNPVTAAIPEENYMFRPLESDLFRHDLDWHMRRDTCPLPLAADREGYQGDRHLAYWGSGLVQFLRVRGLYEKYAGPLRKGAAFFDLGCASGRILRHACLQPEEELEVIGCDISVRNVEWMRCFLPERIRIFQNTILPHLPLADNSVDVITAFSVFTHTDDLEFAWLMELARVLRPGGIACISFFSDNLWLTLGRDPNLQWLIDGFAEKCDKPYRRTRETFLQPMPQGRMAFWNDRLVYNTDLFHHRDYVRREWGRFFAVRDIVPYGIDVQDLAVLQKR